MTAFILSVQRDEEESIGNWGKGGTKQTSTFSLKSSLSIREICLSIRAGQENREIPSLGM